MKSDSDISRVSPYATLKGEQVFMQHFQRSVISDCFCILLFNWYCWHSVLSDMCCYFQVAAKINAGDVDKDEWFVVKVMHYDKETKE